MRRLLLDANLSTRPCEFLSQTFGLDVVDLKSLGLEHLNDPQVVDYALGAARIVVSYDLDFGRLYYRYERGSIGIIILRLRSQRTAAVHRVVGRFFADEETATLPLERSLIVIDDHHFRLIDEQFRSS